MPPANTIWQLGGGGPGGLMPLAAAAPASKYPRLRSMITAAAAAATAANATTMPAATAAAGGPDEGDWAAGSGTLAVGGAARDVRSLYAEGERNSCTAGPAGALGTSGAAERAIMDSNLRWRPASAEMNTLA
jgi:hypothetical protein